jgi:hypothetical protein
VATGGNNRYPSLEFICELFRAQINDSFAGATNTPGEGLIMTDLNPDTLIFLNAAVRDVYADLRNIGDPALILDNYILLGIPAIAAINQALQVSLDVIGYFNGFMFSNQWTLPAGCMRVERIWERWTGSQGDFLPMTPAPFGIAGVSQTQRMNCWETRQNAIWMPGCLVPVDLRLRCLITFPDFLNPASINFSTTYVPILNCQNNVVDKMVVRYARRFAPEQYATAKDAQADSLFSLRQEVTRNMQNTEYQRNEWGAEATTGYGWLASL